MALGGDDTTLLLSALRQLTHIEFPSRRRWILDGLPLLAQIAYLEREKGAGAATAYLESHRSALVEMEKEHAAASADKAQHSLINSNDEFYVAAKAMNVWWMLREIVGENSLIAALHNYKVEDDTRADYMEKLIEAQAHRDLEWFFDDWVYRDRGLPDLRIVSVYPRQLAAGGYMVTVTIENLGTAAAEVPVTLKMAATEASDKVVVASKSTASIRIQTPAMPLEAVVNDGSVPEADASNNSFRISSEAK
jgi:aminopeptidase N